MPQFDQFSFLNQVSWFIFFFLMFYFLITYFFLPTVCYNLKFRKKKILINITKKNQINFEKNSIISLFNDSYKNFCSNFETFLFIKKSVYTLKESNSQKSSLVNNLLKDKINIFLNQKFLLFKKVFI